MCCKCSKALVILAENTTRSLWLDHRIEYVIAPATLIPCQFRKVSDPQGKLLQGAVQSWLEDHVYLQSCGVLQSSVNFAEYCKSHTESYAGLYVRTCNKSQHLFFRRVLFLYSLSFPLLLIPLSTTASGYFLLKTALQQAHKLRGLCLSFP